MAASESELNQLLIQVGHGLLSWTQVETALSIVFGIASEIPRDKAHAIYDGIVAFEARLAVTDRVMEMELSDELDRETWARLSARIRKFYQKRHAMAHFALAMDKQGTITNKIAPFFTWQKHDQGRVQTLDLAQLEERTAKFRELEKAVMWFAWKLRERNKPGSVLPKDIVETSLIPHLRELAIRSLEERKKRPQSREG